MPNLLMVGETNNGKTMLVQRFRKQHPASNNPGGDDIVLPVLVIQSPPVADEVRHLLVRLRQATRNLAETKK